MIELVILASVLCMALWFGIAGMLRFPGGVVAFASTFHTVDLPHWGSPRVSVRLTRDTRDWSVVCSVEANFCSANKRYAAGLGGRTGAGGLEAL